MNAIFVTGSDTEVGKTWISCAILEAWKAAGASPVPYKPIEAGIHHADGVYAADARALKQAAAFAGLIDSVCPYPLDLAMSPPRAARKQAVMISLDALIANCPKADVLLVEGAGGFYSPLCENALNADLARALKLPVVLVVANRLGCLNHALLSIKAIRDAGLSIAAVFVNETAPDTGDVENASDLAELCDESVITVDFNQAQPVKDWAMAYLNDDV